MESAEHSPPRIIPHLGQVSDHSSKPSRSEHCGVFHKHAARSHLANDTRHFSPQPGTLTVDAGTLSRGADVLAREAASDDIHHSTPRLSVEGSNVIPDGEGFKASIVLAGDEDVAGVLVEFDGTHGCPAKELAAENAASSACEKRQLIHVSC
jgi:hypothetical protein